MGRGWPLQDWASGSAPGHLAGRVAMGTWCVVPSFILKETGLCPTPRPDPGKQTVTGEKGGSGSGSDSDSGSRRVQVLPRLLPLQPPHVLLAWSLGQLIRAFLFLEYIQSRPHQGLVLQIPVSRMFSQDTLRQDCPTLHTSAQSPSSERLPW